MFGTCTSIISLCTTSSRVGSRRDCSPVQLLLCKNSQEKGFKMSNTHRALVLNSFKEPISVQTLPIPTAVPGSAVVRVLGLSIIPYLRGILDNSLQYPITLPIVPSKPIRLLIDATTHADSF